MNILARNIELTNSMEEFIIESLDFIDEFSTKESYISLTNNKNEINFMFSFDVEGKGCTVKIKDVDFKKGIKKIRNKSYQKVMSIIRKPVCKDTIRKMKPIDEVKDGDSKTLYIEVESLDKPMTEKDAQDVMIEKRLSNAIFINIDYNDCLTLMQRDKDKFKIYLTDIELH